MKPEKSQSGLSALRSLPSHHLHSVLSQRSEIRSINAKDAADDVDLLAQIGYKQELRRSYSTIQVFGIAFSIMGLLPSIATVMSIGLECGPAALVWGWFLAGIFILLTGVSLSFLSSAIPTSGGLFYYSNYYAPEAIRVPLSFIIGVSNTMALCSGLCSINYGFAAQVLAAVYVSQDGNFNITNGIKYGVFAAATLVEIVACCFTTRGTALLQSTSIVVNVFLIVLFFIAVPIGASKNGFNDGGFIFGKIENIREWSTGWSFMLSWMPALWTIGAFDSCLHMSEECKNPQKKVPIGIIGSIAVCWIVGWFICIASVAMIKDGDISRVLETDTGSVMTQIFYDALGKKWAIALISLISFAQLMMAISLLIALSRQIFAFARDDGLPFCYKYVKVINPLLKIPVRASIFGGILSLILGLLILINAVAANALFSLAVAGNLLAWGVPIFLILLPVGKLRFIPGPFWFGDKISSIINIITVVWLAYAMIMCMFPDSKTVDSQTMNYTVAISCGVWLLAAVYYFFYGYRHYHGPVSNLDVVNGSSLASEEVHNVDEMLQEKA